MSSEYKGASREGLDVSLVKIARIQSETFGLMALLYRLQHAPCLNDGPSGLQRSSSEVNS